MKCKNWSLEQKRALLDSAKGRYFFAEWIKRDGSVRQAVGKKWERKFLHGEPGQNANTVAHKPQYYTYCEEKVEGYRNLSLDTLRKVKVNGVVYEFEEE